MSDLEEEKRRRQELFASVGAFGCVLGFGNYRDPGLVAYASSPVTTGYRMYAAFRTSGVTSVEQLKAKDSAAYRREIMDPNIAAGESFAAQLRATARYKHVISPASFFAQGWTQDHYMAFWRSTIKAFANAVHLNEGWESSNGCVEEYLIAYESGKLVYEGLSDAPLFPSAAAEKIYVAIEKIAAQGASVEKLLALHHHISIAALIDRKSTPLLR
ncbi:MAG TPA: DUF4406 domain-containing protein [Candidatus Nanoarchaeia archaeon]|nr:DUF4406 domain-containing protein [Candidatus Nanoarchaeia archaeon]